MILNKNNTLFTRIYPQILRKRLKLLIKAGAMKGNKDQEGRTAIEYARAIKKPELADFMLEKFAKEQVKKKHGIVSTSSFTKFGKIEAISEQKDSASKETSSTPKMDQ